MTTTRLLTPHLLHIWHCQNFHILRTARSDPLSAAAICPHFNLWLSSANRTTIIHLSASQATHLPPVSFDSARDIGVGNVHALIVNSADSHSSLCHCTVDAFGENGFVRVHSNAETSHYKHTNITYSIAAALLLERGNIVQHIVNVAYAPLAVVTASATGVVRVAPGADILQVIRSAKWSGGGSDVVNLAQRPVLAVTDPAQNFVVVLGVLRAGVVLFPGKDGIAARRFVLKGGSQQLTSFSMLVVEGEQDVGLVLEESCSGHRTAFSYDSVTQSITVMLDYDNKLHIHFDPQNQSDTLRNLLQGIQHLSDCEATTQQSCDHAENIISSYNSALLFALEFRQQSGDGTTHMSHACSLTTEQAPTATSPRFQLPSPLTGRELYIAVSFQNGTGVAMADGWMLRLSIRDRKPASGKIFPNSDDHYTTSVMTAPFAVQPSKTRTLSFPVVLDSHAPIEVSVLLVFQHPSETAGKQQPVDIEILLHDWHVLDILNFSCKARDNALDSSHANLGKAQIMHYFRPQLVEKNRGHPLSVRFELPVPSATVQRILNVGEEKCSFQSLLGAVYTISVSPVSQIHEADKDKLAMCTMTVRSVPHVIPFVRAAVLRRIVEILSTGESVGLVVRGEKC